jgi:hypothetical protein
MSEISFSQPAHFRLLCAELKAYFCARCMAATKSSRESDRRHLAALSASRLLLQSLAMLVP